jgi:hypothetical protein
MKKEQPINLICNCCGKAMKNTPEENIDFNTGRRDYGYGTCMECAEFAQNKFFNGLIPQVLNALNPENKAKFERLSKTMQHNFIHDMIQKGIIHY